jgi:Integrase zinc binding domain/Chromo (CHRromatin Organisation MOdifier) domain
MKNLQTTRQRHMNTTDSDSDTVVGDEDEPIKAWAATLEDGSQLSAIQLDDKLIRDQTNNLQTINCWCTAHQLSKQGNLWTHNGALVVVGNNDTKRGVISLFHDIPTAGHPGIMKTLLMTTKFYWWPGIKDFVTNYVKGCATCQMTKVNTHPTKPALFPITAEPNALPFQTVAIDFIVKLPISNRYDSILTIMDHDCSKAVIFLPCNETINTLEVAELYARHIFPHYRLPLKVISDRDPRFTANFTKELCETIGIKQNISSAYHPQTDGQSERTNQSLEQYLRAFCGSKQDQWAHWLPIAQYTKNSWPHATTKKMPYDLILGYTPTAHQPTRQTDIPDLNKRIKDTQLARKEAQEAMSKAQERLIKGTKFKGYEVGQKVWLEGTNIKRPYDSPKLSPKRYGPFEVVAKISHMAYRLRLPETWQIHDMFHTGLLTPFTETEEHGQNFIEPPPEVIEGEEEWEVEQILGKRTYGRGRKTQYLIRWKGYSPAHDQWVDKTDMNATDLVDEYET